MAKKEQLSQEMLDNIKNYASEIKTLKDFVTAVRQNIGMYIGSKGDKGFINMIREILQNSFDELTKEGSPCTWIKISFDELTKTVIIEDNGRGIPFNNIIRIFNDQHTSSNYDKKPGEYSSGLHGVGSKVTNALSSSFIIESYILGDARRVEFTDGYPWNKGEVKIPNKENKQGTMIMFTPSTDALGDLGVTWKQVKELVELILPLTKIGATVYFSAIDEKGKEHYETLVNEDGIMTFLIKKVVSPVVKPICVFKDTGYMKMDISFTFDASENSFEEIVAFGNCCPTSSGYHIDGFLKGISYWFSNYMNKIYLVGNKKNKITINQQDVRSGIKSVISVAHLHPIFNGQAKEILSNEDMEPFVRSGVIEALDQWAKTNPSDLNKVCKYLKDIAEIRLKADKEKIKLSNKYDSSALTGLPSKYVAPTGNKDLELWLVEGLSAGGSLKNHRNNKTQGYYPLRGKIPNAFDTSKEKFLSNAEIAGMIKIIGGGYGRSFDITKVKWKYIIIGTDADPDGEHISSLLIRFFILYMPGLIESGRVYKSNPPLYGMYMGKNKMQYFINRLDYIKFVQKKFTKDHDIKTFDNKSISKDNLSKILYTNIDYTYELNKISNRYSINPILLESLITIRNNSFKDIKSKIKKLYRFLDVKDINGTTVIEGVVDGKYQTIFFNERLINDCNSIIKIMNKNESLVYSLDGESVSLYEMMSIFNESEPTSLQRYKGLGEMDGDQLFESTLDIENRTLIRYTLENAKKEIEEIRKYESNKALLLTDVQVTRFDIMG